MSRHRRNRWSCPDFGRGDGISVLLNRLPNKHHDRAGRPTDWPEKKDENTDGNKAKIGPRKIRSSVELVFNCDAMFFPSLEAMGFKCT